MKTGERRASRDGIAGLGEDLDAHRGIDGVFGSETPRAHGERPRSRSRGHRWS